MNRDQLKRAIEELIEHQRRRQWEGARFLVRAIAITIGVCAATAAVGSLASSMWRAKIEGSQGGRISRDMRAITPDVERRNKEAEELTNP
jgi:hypothetical protein